ncbi:MAG: hypothetical protein KDK37_03100 [Leptospiraceae bacterium]|nr:hypothetical protein [Leptospiraceae bacterium]
MMKLFTSFAYNHFPEWAASFTLIFAISATVVSGESPSASRSDPVREFEGSDYLDRQIASKKIDGLRNIVEVDLVRLGRMMEVLGSDVSGANVKYEETAAVFKKAIDAYYSGQLLESYYLLRDARRRAFEVYASFNAQYENKVAEILGKTTAALVDRELAEAGRAKSRTVKETRHRIDVARRQLLTAQRLIANERPDAAVQHFRNATVLAVIALAEVQKDDQQKDQVYEQYKKELKDAGYNPYPLRPDKDVKN